MKKQLFFIAIVIGIVPVTSHGMEDPAQEQRQTLVVRERLLLHEIPKDIQRIISQYVAGEEIIPDNFVKAAENGDYQGVKAFLDLGFNPNVLSQNDFSALMRAVINNHANIVELLLHRGANPDLKGIQDTTALMYAAQYASPQIVRLLLEKGADPNAQTAKERIPSEIVSDQFQLVYKGEWTPLMMAANLGRRNIVELLLTHGARKNITNFSNRKASDIAREAGFEPLARFIDQN